MPKRSDVPMLAGGAFFGKPSWSVVTPSFHFCELQATVPERQVPRHTHESPHFILITQGAYVTEARNQDGVCPPGTFIFNPGGITHQDRFCSFQGSFLSITVGSEPSNDLNTATPVPIILGGPAQAGGEFELGQRIVRELRDRRDSCNLILEGLGLELIATLSGVAERTAAKMVPRWLISAKELIEDCCSNDLRMADLAAAAGVHPVYLARAYRRYFGYSPGEHLRRCRVLSVQTLLANSDMPLADIALQCGYSDQSQMTRAFTGLFGMPPARYRGLRGR